MKSVRAIFVNVCRLIVALTFILSGYVKAIDPLGTQYKIVDYLEAAHLGEGLPDWFSLIASVALPVTEFVLGILLILAVHRRVVTRITLCIMLFMTGVTVWLYVADPISDCGCFGDALVLTNGQTLLKNILLLVMTVLLVCRDKQMYRLMRDSHATIVFNYSVIFVLGTALYSLYFLPQFDFRPYHIGANIKEGMEMPEGAKAPKYDTTFIMEKDGKRQEFTLEDYPDSTWTFIDSQPRLIEEGYVPPIHDFCIMNAEGEDITEDVLTYKGYSFLLIAPFLNKADDSNFGQIEQIYEYANEHHYPFICLTSSGAKDISRWQDATGAEYPFCFTDGTVLKTVIRSNPGLLLLKDGTIIQKWSHNNLPRQEMLTSPLEQLSIGKEADTSSMKKIIEMLAIFFIPLVLLSFIDRSLLLLRWKKK